MKKCHKSNKTRQSCLSNDVITHHSLQERGDEVMRWIRLSQLSVNYDVRASI